MDMHKYLDALVQLTTALAALVTALGPVALVLWPAMRKLILPRIRNAHVRNAFDRLGEMGLVAANTAAAALRVELEKAKDPRSPGGKEVTPDELRQAYARAAAVSKQWAKDRGVLDAVLAVLPEQQVDEALSAMVSKKLHGNPVGEGFGGPEMVPGTALAPTYPPLPQQDDPAVVVPNNG